MFGDMLIWAMVLPGMLLGGFAQTRVKAAVARYSKVALSSGLTGAQVARHILDQRGLQNVRVERVKGVLSDHYDPRSKVLRLSEPVFDIRSVAAAGIAAHEAGHAIQDADDYLPLEARSFIVPAVRLGSGVAPLVFMGGLAFDASRRALKQLEGLGIIRDDTEMSGARKVLGAAAWTYVAAAVSAIGAWAMYLMMSRRR